MKNNSTSGWPSQACQQGGREGAYLGKPLRWAVGPLPGRCWGGGRGGRQRHSRSQQDSIGGETGQQQQVGETVGQKVNDVLLTGVQTAEDRKAPECIPQRCLELSDVMAPSS